MPVNILSSKTNELDLLHFLTKFAPPQLKKVIAKLKRVHLGATKMVKWARTPGLQMKVEDSGLAFPSRKEAKRGIS